MVVAKCSSRALAERMCGLLDGKHRVRFEETSEPWPWLILKVGR